MDNTQTRKFFAKSIVDQGKTTSRSHRGDMMRGLASVVALVALGGCSSFSQISDPERSEQVTGIDKHSSYPAIRRVPFENVNLLELVDPEKKAQDIFPEAWKDTEKHKTTDDKFGARYDLVLSWFRQRDDLSASEKRRRRNSMQERIISVSVSRCNVFKTYLRRDQSNQNFLLGTLTTVSGALGAILNGANASRNLAGMAGIFSGVRAEYNQAYYSNLAAHVIVKGIETKQEVVYRRIQTEGQKKGIDDYPLEAAIKDAIYFDGLCSVVAGLDQASASVDATLEPGLDAATRTLLRARLAKEAMDMPREELLKPETLDRIGLAGNRLGLSLVGSARGEPAQESSEVDLFAAASELAEQTLAAGDTAAAAINRAATARRDGLIDKLKASNPDAAKKHEDSAKKVDIPAAVKALLSSKLYGPLKFGSCYSKIAASAVEARLSAVRNREKASKDDEKINADYLIKTATLEIQKAHDQLRRKGKLVNLDLTTYESQRIDAIKDLTIENLLDASMVAGDFALTAAKDESCS